MLKAATWGKCKNSMSTRLCVWLVSKAGDEERMSRCPTFRRVYILFFSNARDVAQGAAASMSGQRLPCSRGIGIHSVQVTAAHCSAKQISESWFTKGVDSAAGNAVTHTLSVSLNAKVTFCRNDMRQSSKKQEEFLNNNSTNSKVRATVRVTAVEVNTDQCECRRECRRGPLAMHVGCR